jgi:hypothetical protein
LKLAKAGARSVATESDSALGEGQRAKLSSTTAAVKRTPQETSDHVPHGAGSHELPVGYLAGELDDAERLLGYAAEVGIEVEDNVRDAILSARVASGSGMSEEVAANLLAALTKLAARVRPVTAESLRASSDPTQSLAVVRGYTRIAIVLTAFIIPSSLATFVSSAISDAIRKDTEIANALAVKLSDELGPPQQGQEITNGRAGVNTLPRGVSEKDAIRDLQQFAAAIRAIDARARQLNLFTGHSVTDPLRDRRADPNRLKEKLELPPSLPDLPQAATDKIAVYQDIRYFAQSIQEALTTWSGAIASCVLPVLYALLGACAYLLRLFEEQMRNRTFTAGDRHVARFFIAAIGGLVVGLFNNLNVTQGGTLPPLALAFLVGYAVDVFFSFLEGILQSFSRARATQASAPNSKG